MTRAHGAVSGAEVMLSVRRQLGLFGFAYTGGIEQAVAAVAECRSDRDPYLVAGDRWDATVRDLRTHDPSWVALPCVARHVGLLAERQGRSAGTAGAPQGRHDHEDLKGLSGNDVNAEEDKFPERGGRSHRASRRDPHGSGRFIPGDDTARFWSKVHKTRGGCWLWTGALSSDGYGRFRITVTPGRHRHVKAHRWAWEHLVGPIPAGWTLDHLVAPGPCASRACVRPDHLEPVTRPENARRAARRRRTSREDP